MKYHIDTYGCQMNMADTQLLASELERMGHQAKRAFHSYPFAAPHGITLWDGALEGGADPQRDGMAAGLD